MKKRLSAASFGLIVPFFEEQVYDFLFEFSLYNNFSILCRTTYAAFAFKQLAKLL